MAGTCASGNVRESPGKIPGERSREKSRANLGINPGNPGTFPEPFGSGDSRGNPGDFRESPGIPWDPRECSGIFREYPGDPIGIPGTEQETKGESSTQRIKSRDFAGTQRAIHKKFPGNSRKRKVQEIRGNDPRNNLGFRGPSGNPLE